MMTAWLLKWKHNSTRIAINLSLRLRLSSLAYHFTKVLTIFWKDQSWSKIAIFLLVNENLARIIRRQSVTTVLVVWFIGSFL